MTLNIHPFRTLFASSYQALLLPILLTTLSACSALQYHQDDQSITQNELALTALTSWDLQGRLNVRSNSESRTINVRWSQAEDNFTLNLSGTMNLGAVKIEGNETYLVMEKSGDDPIYANNLEELGNTYLGYPLPSHELKHWIRGLPYPATVFLESRSEDGMLQELTQADWHIIYQDYREHDGLWLPTRLRLENNDFRLTLLNLRWTLPIDQEMAQ